MSIINPANTGQGPDTIGIRPPLTPPANTTQGPDTTGTAPPAAQTTPPVPNTTGTAGTVLNSIA